MNWHQYVEWTDTTAKPSNDGWEALREGMVEECHEALAVYHQIKAIEHGAIKRLHRDGPPDARQLGIRKMRMDQLRQWLVTEVGDACWYAARIARLLWKSDWEVDESDIDDYGMPFDEILNGTPDAPEKWALALLAGLLRMTGVTLDEALTNNEAKLLARKAAGTIGGEGER